MKDGIYWIIGASGSNWILPGYVTIAELRDGNWWFMGSDEFVSLEEAEIIAGPLEPPVIIALDTAPDKM